HFCSPGGSVRRFEVIGINLELGVGLGTANERGQNCQPNDVSSNPCGLHNSTPRERVRARAMSGLSETGVRASALLVRGWFNLLLPGISKTKGETRHEDEKDLTD